MEQEKISIEQVLNSLKGLGISPERPLRVAWFSFFPIEWQTHVPDEIRNLPRRHPASWQTVLLSQFEGMPLLDLHVIVVRRTFERSIRFIRNNVTFHCLKTPPGLRALSFYWADTFLVNGVLRRIKPDLVHGWGSEFAGASIAARLPYPNLVTMQGILSWLEGIFPLNSQQKICAFLEKRALPKLKHVTAESSFSMRYLKEHWPHLELRQIEHAPNPVFQSVARRPQLGPQRIVMVSSLSYAKGVDVLFGALEALKEKMQFDVTLVGGATTEFEQEIKKKTSAEILARCTFKDNLTPEQVAEELATATFMVYPTRADSSPNAVKEAVVAGVPVVASRVGGIVDYVWPERNGFLFEAGNVAECAAAIEKAASHPIFGRGEVEAGALSEARNYLSAETMALKMLDAYANVVAENQQGAHDGKD